MKFYPRYCQTYQRHWKSLLEELRTNLLVRVKVDLENRIRKLYSNVILPNHNLDKLFRPSLVSIADDKLLINQFLESAKNDFEDGV
ncbi:MAG: hypothetical protein P8I58_02860 [Flavobacteriaceae bacterium]|nr:hypothetical protein [Flavobacteriaceae bacterium]